MSLFLPVRTRSALSLFFVIVAFSSTGFAQKPPMKWGNIPMEHLEMTTFPADTNATAVVLCDFSEVEFDEHLDLVIKRHMRVKILKEAGYEWGTVKLPYRHSGKSYRKQRIKGLKGQTINLTADGKIEKHKLEKSAVFDEDTDGTWHRKKFTLPALKPGSVIEYSYKIETGSWGDLTGWTFQHKEPTLWSEFRTQIPEVLTYVSVFQGYETPDIQEAKEYTQTTTVTFKSQGDFYSTHRETSTEYFEYDGFRKRWVMQDIPALRKEPYMTTVNDYLAKIRFQLSTVNFPGQMLQNYLTTWSKLAEELMKDDDFGKQIQKHKKLRKLAELLVTGIKDPKQKLKVIYDYVKDNIKWNDIRGIYADEQLDKTYKARAGDGAAISLTLLSMLKDVGLNAYPVLISTRNHGQVLPAYPLASQFNSVLVYAEVGGGTGFLLDATDPNRPYHLVPVQALNNQGWLIADEVTHQWIPVTATEFYSREATMNVRLDDQGSLTGSLKTKESGYSALFKRNALLDDDDEDFVKDIILGNLSEVDIDSSMIENKKEIEKNLLVETHFQAPNYAQAVGDFIYLNPMVVDRIDENPLKLAERKFPVDYAYRRETVNRFTFEIPEGYKVEEKLQNLTFKTTAGGAEYQRVVQIGAKIISVDTRIGIYKTKFEPTEYVELRSFYDKVVAAHAEQIVLKKSPKVTSN